ncbi:MAG: DUF1735 domain-containing protein [Chitinophagaceae bacterium]
MNKRLYFLIAAFTIAAFGMVGCKKDQNVLANASAGSKDAVGFGINNGDYIFLDIPGDLTTMDTSINVFLSSGKTYGSDITVTLTPNADLVTAYNDANGAEYDDMPTDTYTMPLTITIPANSKEGTGKLSIDLTKLLSYGIQFGLGFTVSSVQGGPSTILDDHKNLLIVANVRNQWDGIYAYGPGSTISRNSATGPDPALSGSTEGLTVELPTTSANTLSYVPVWHGGGGIAGIDGTYLTIDPATNEVTVASAANPVLKNTVGEDNYYDPATKTFHLAFDWGTAPNTRVVKATLVYQGPR